LEDILSSREIDAAVDVVVGIDRWKEGGVANSADSNATPRAKETLNQTSNIQPHDSLRQLKRWQY